MIELQWGMVIDLRRCVGCYACTVACQIENGLDLEERWNKVFKVGPEGHFPYLTYHNFTVACMHCQEAPCVEGCPTGASKREENGIVVVDENRCIGCKFCVLVCPYGARRFDHKRGIVRKCTLCISRLENGELPRCVETCQLKARYVGDLDDPEGELVQMIRKENAQPLYPHLGTRPSVYYIIP